MNSEQIIYKAHILDVNNVQQHIGGLGEMPKITLECTPANSSNSLDALSKQCKVMLNDMYGVASMITGGSRNYTCVMPRIKKVIFNDPATIVFWKDGTKTVVKSYKDEFDPEKGLAMAITKKALGNHGNYYNEIRKYVKSYYDKHKGV